MQLEVEEIQKKIALKRKTAREERLAAARAQKQKDLAEANAKKGGAFGF